MLVIWSPNEGVPDAGGAGADIAGGRGIGASWGSFLFTDLKMAGAKMIAGMISATIGMI